MIFIGLILDHYSLYFEGKRGTNHAYDTPERQCFFLFCFEISTEFLLEKIPENSKELPEKNKNTKIIKRKSLTSYAPHELSRAVFFINRGAKFKAKYNYERAY